MPGLVPSAPGGSGELDLPWMAPLPGIRTAAAWFSLVSRLRGDSDPQSDSLPLDGGPDGGPECASTAGELPRLLLP